MKIIRKFSVSRSLLPSVSATETADNLQQKKLTKNKFKAHVQIAHLGFLPTRKITDLKKQKSYLLGNA